MENYFEYKGIVEGFYGREWSHGERKDILSFMGKKGYNLYIYAPKTDPFHRVRWKDPYPYGYDKEFAELINLAAKNNVEFSVAVSPGLSLIYSHDEDLEKL
ncbi:MAG TPA: beta-N-acetylglucosaminidase domain-containing protein, partial [Petrotogaceae bacterium]|nr:beta-N-acetylglucosaminidase domain-containing protein [Petrotogaceae bacterium]